MGPGTSPQLKLSQLLLHGVPISQRAKNDSFIGGDYVGVVLIILGHEALPDTIPLLRNGDLQLLIGDICGDGIWYMPSRVQSCFQTVMR